jgi:hypothetical protein
MSTGDVGSACGPLQTTEWQYRLVVRRDDVRVRLFTDAAGCGSLQGAIRKARASRPNTVTLAATAARSIEPDNGHSGRLDLPILLDLRLGSP